MAALNIWSVWVAEDERKEAEANRREQERLRQLVAEVPEELWVQILLFVADPLLILAFRSVARRFARLAWSNEVWRPLFHSHFGLYSQGQHEGRWCVLYFHHLWTLREAEAQRATLLRLLRAQEQEQGREPSIELSDGSRTCLDCGNLFWEPLNHPRACQRHSATYNTATLKWNCCRERERGHRGCLESPHRTTIA
jgi:hypothetical protein